MASSRAGRTTCHRPVRPRGRSGRDHGAATGSRPDDLGPPTDLITGFPAPGGAERMSEDANSGPDSSAVRVALWRALHVQVDAPPHVLEDEVGLLLANPEDGWRQRPDMDPEATSGFRAAIVARARFMEDLVTDHADAGIHQYVVLGAGLDTFAQRHPSVGSYLHVFEIDQPATQAWK